MIKRRIVEECKGCKSLIKLPLKSECRFTPEGVLDIPICPCKDCLVKVLCVDVCDKLSILITELNSRTKVKNFEARYKRQ